MVLSRGRLVEFGPPHELLQQYLPRPLSQPASCVTDDVRSAGLDSDDAEKMTGGASIVDALKMAPPSSFASMVAETGEQMAAYLAAASAAAWQKQQQQQQDQQHQQQEQQQRQQQ